MIDYRALLEAHPENILHLARSLELARPAPLPHGSALLCWKRHAARTVADKVAYRGPQ